MYPDKNAMASSAFVSDIVKAEEAARLAWGSAPDEVGQSPSNSGYPNIAVRIVHKTGALEIFAVVEQPPTGGLVSLASAKSAPQLYKVARFKTDIMPLPEKDGKIVKYLLITDSDEDLANGRSPVHPVWCTIPFYNSEQFQPGLTQVEVYTATIIAPAVLSALKDQKPKVAVVVSENETGIRKQVAPPRRSRKPPS